MSIASCFSRIPKFTAAALLALAALSASADSKQKVDYENRLASVNTLIGALNSAPEAGSEAKANVTKVNARKKEAEELAKLGEYDAAKEILDEGYRLLTQTLAKTKSGSGYTGQSSMGGMSASETGRDKATRDMAERNIASAKTMLDAAKRSGASAGDVARIGGTVGKADQRAAAGDYAAADQLAKESLGELRTLIVSLKGESGNSGGSVASSASSSGSTSPAAVDARIASGKALIDALKRQNAEKGGGKESVISDSEAKLRQAEAIRTADPAAALAMANEAYKAAQGAIQSLQSPSNLKSGSAALQASAGTGASDEQRAETDRLVKSSLLLRDSIERIDALSGEARTRQGSDPARALQAATEANQLAKDTLSTLR
jgi:hypothetical protein